MSDQEAPVTPKRAVLSVSVDDPPTLPEHIRENVIKVFHETDVNKNGVLEVDEIQRAFTQMGKDIHVDAVVQMMEECSEKESHAAIDLSEFIDIIAKQYWMKQNKRPSVYIAS